MLFLHVSLLKKCVLRRLGASLLAPRAFLSSFVSGGGPESRTAALPGARASFFFFCICTEKWDVLKTLPDPETTHTHAPIDHLRLDDGVAAIEGRLAVFIPPVAAAAFAALELLAQFGNLERRTRAESVVRSGERSGKEPKPGESN